MWTTSIERRHSLLLNSIFTILLRESGLRRRYTQNSVNSGQENQSSSWLHDGRMISRETIDERSDTRPVESEKSRSQEEVEDGLAVSR